MVQKNVSHSTKPVSIATIGLSKPLDRLLASQVDYKEWYDLRIEALLMQANMKNSPLRGMVGARVGLIPHQLYIAHEVGQRLHRVSYLLTKSV